MGRKGGWAAENSLFAVLNVIKQASVDILLIENVGGFTSRAEDQASGQQRDASVLKLANELKGENWPFIFRRLDGIASSARPALHRER